MSVIGSNAWSHKNYCQLVVGMRISFSKISQILKMDTLYPQSCINQGEKWQNAAEFYHGHCNGTMIVYDERNVTEIWPISEVARGWP